MTKQIGFRVRLRVRIGKPLTSDAVKLSTTIGGRHVEIRSQDPEQPLKEANWIVLTARGFATDAEAKEFGEHSKQILILACLAVRLGVDVGTDKPTSSVSEQFARDIGFVQPHERIAPNVHGVLVIPDDDLTRIALIHAKGTVSADPNALLTALSEADCDRLNFSAAERGIRVMNEALMHPEPLGQLLLAYSAVEELGQTENWSCAQKDLISEIYTAVSAGMGDTIVSDPERAEVAEAILKGLFRLSLRQGVVRLLRDNDLLQYKSKWDELYGHRSGLVHGTKTMTDGEINNLAQQAIDLCGLIIMRVLEKSGVPIPKIMNGCWGQWLSL